MYNCSFSIKMNSSARTSGIIDYRGSEFVQLYSSVLKMPIKGVPMDINNNGIIHKDNANQTNFPGTG